MKTYIEQLNNDVINQEWMREMVELWNINAIETADCELDESDREAIHEQLKEYITSKYGMVVVAMNEHQQIIGYSIASVKKDLVSGELSGQLDEVYVAPEYRGKKLAKKLVDNVIKWLDQQNISLIHVHVDIDNKLALKFWEKNGFDIEFFTLSNNE
ncbi:GNAT family N-acetyltransferase [Massilibacterium senegalense]|uniref:GNAT family N-acetyltransferase n=1 Tax=Massilibacterium senegalense TaxID=1632858 RepID=UPI0007813794|nr:GNAT family N-acetyltransferase [Massilibacterium senegalense]